MSDEAIKISIIVPIYNVENYVKPCIESVMGQSYKNLEIILVDDGSTDNCPLICDDYAKKDKRIHVIHKCNGGLVSARKAGIAIATGDYVLGVDGDDWIEEDRVEVLVRDGIMPTYADMIHLSGYIRDFEGGKKESKRENFDVPIKLFENDEIANTVFPLMLGTGGWGLCEWAIRRDLLLTNQMLVDDHITFGEDFLCVCFCLLEAKSAMVLKQAGYHYIQRASSITRQIINTSSDNNLFCMKIWYQVLMNQLKQKHAPEKICKVCGRVAISHIMRTNYDLILQKFSDYLFPFPKVKNGARIVVYGAGEFGHRLVLNLDKTKRCSVVLWVDQNQNLPALPGYTICSRDTILSADYDFIAVAIMNDAVAEEVKCTLIQDGVPEEKIATMDASVISEDAIPDEIKDFQIQ